MKFAHNRININESELYELYVINKKNINECAKIFNCSAQPIIIILLIPQRIYWF